MDGGQTGTPVCSIQPWGVVCALASHGVPAAYELHGRPTVMGFLTDTDMTEVPFAWVQGEGLL